jgi:type VI secretion system protein ImpG
MRDELLHYYERELRFIRRELGDFAERYPAVAGQLLLEPDKCEDPHVERLIEAFSMLAARVRLRLDEDFPRLTAAMLEFLLPGFLDPFPSATIVQLVPDPDRADAAGSISVPRHTQLYTPPVDGVRCRFRTCYDVELRPLAVTDVDVVGLGRGELDGTVAAGAALRIRLRTLGSRTIGDLQPDRLRFFLDGDPNVAHRVHELCLRDPRGVVVRPVTAAGQASGADRQARWLEADCLQPVGFAVEESLLGSTAPDRLGYRLLQEYLAFPEKYLFCDLVGLAGATGGLGREAEILILLESFPRDLEGQLGVENFKLGCTPAVNLFPHQAEPIRVSGTLAEHPVVPDAHEPLAYEVHSIRDVVAVSQDTGEEQSYRPFYELRHGDRNVEAIGFWSRERRPAQRRGDDGTEVYLTLVDPRGEPPRVPSGETLVVRTFCTNRDLPPRLPLGGRQGDFQIEGRPGVTRIQTLRKPTRPLRDPGAEGQHWRLVSLLNLQHLSLVGSGEDGEPTALRELLSLLDITGSAVAQQRISGLVGIRSRRVLRRVTCEGVRIFARGLEVTLELDEAKYAGSSAFLFTSVLEAFMGLYATINSFTQTVATVRQREGVLKRWPPRTGDRPLI